MSSGLRLTRSATRLTRLKQDAGDSANQQAGKVKAKTAARKRPAEVLDEPGDSVGHDQPSTASAKRAKTSKNSNPPYLNPFPTAQAPPTIPEPTLSVAEHEAHSQNIAGLLEDPKSGVSPSGSDGRSPFQVALSVKERNIERELTAPPAAGPLQAPEKAKPRVSPVSLPPMPNPNAPSQTPRSSVAPSSRGPRSSVAPTSQGPRSSAAPMPRGPRSSVAPMSRGPFIAPALSSPAPAHSFTLPENNLPPLEKQSAPALKPNKHITHLIAELTGRVERIDKDMKAVTQAEKILRARYDTVVKENKVLTEQAVLIDAEVWEMREELNEQKTLVASILGAIDDLKASAGAGRDVVRAAGKVQSATKDNAFAVSMILLAWFMC